MVHNTTFGTRSWQSHDQIWTFLKFKMVDGCAILKIVFGHNLAADCPIWVKFCMGSSFFTEFRQWDRYPCSTSYIFCLPNALWASASGGFRIVSDTLVIGKTGKPYSKVVRQLPCGPYRWRRLYTRLLQDGIIRFWLNCGCFCTVV